MRRPAGAPHPPARDAVAFTFTFTFAPLRRQDLALLEAWLAAPHVSRWFGDSAEWLAEIRANLDGPLDAPWVHYWRVDLADEPAGFAQCYRTDRAPPGAWSGEPAGTLGLDFLLGRAGDLGQGLGSRLVRALVAHVEARHGARRLIADPEPGNGASIGALAAAGFRLDARSGLHVRPGPAGEP
jgi:aminoglycoside 6'-N-acetyltransferase